MAKQGNVPSGKGQRNVPSGYLSTTYGRLADWRSLEFDPAAIALASIKPVNLKNEYSFTSHVLVYEGCPQQYRFFKELEFAPVRKNAILFGTLVHQTIEDVHKTVLRGEENKVTDEQVQVWFRTNYHHLTKRERVDIRNIGRFTNSNGKGNTEQAKYSFIFGANGHGKTTICATLRSAQAAGLGQAEAPEEG